MDRVLSRPVAGQEPTLREVGPEELARIEGGDMYYYYGRGGWGWYSYPPWMRG
jgi:hypothetical protein